jgi:D-tyrosyl-tRNA(Tyr) deacylase
MRAVVQRVVKASVTIDNMDRREIGKGLVVLLGVGPDDTLSDAEYVAGKIAGLRIFSDEAGKMNLNIASIENGCCLLISQFTLYGDARKGMRPSFISAAQPELANDLYEKTAELLTKRHNLMVKTGVFGVDMLVEIHNDGPVTLLIDSKKLF